MLPYIITAVVSIIITALIVWFAAALYQKKSANSKIGNAEEKARGIIDEAVKTAEEKKRESMLEIKEETIRSKNELDKEIKEAIRKANQSSSGSSGGSSSGGSNAGSMNSNVSSSGWAWPLPYDGAYLTSYYLSLIHISEPTRPY